MWPLFCWGRFPLFWKGIVWNLNWVLQREYSWRTHQRDRKIHLLKSHSKPEYFSLLMQFSKQSYVFLQKLLLAVLTSLLWWKAINLRFPSQRFFFSPWKMLSGKLCLKSTLKLQVCSQTISMYLKYREPLWAWGEGGKIKLLKILFGIYNAQIETKSISSLNYDSQCFFMSL